MRSLQLAVLQSIPQIGGPSQAFNRLDRACAEAAAHGADLLVTPEMFLTGYNIGSDAVHSLAEPVAGPMVARAAGLARSHGIGVVCGFPERGEDGRRFNAAVLIDCYGNIVNCCRKTHLFGDVDRAQFDAGDCLCPVADFQGWQIGMAICYDIEFPEVARSLALCGAEAVLVPTANMLPFTGVAERVVPARAEENAIYLAYANYTGSEPPFDYCGLSCLSGPDGRDLARAGTGEVILSAKLSKECLSRARASATHLMDRRPELYRN